MAYLPGGAVPWLPAGASELPAERFVAFADTNNLVQLLNESVKTLDGASFTGIYLSHTLNRKNPAKIYTIKEIAIFYATGVDHTITVRGSGDGARTFPVSKVVALRATLNGQVDQVSIPLGVSGKDLRVQFEFDSDEVANWFGWQPVLIERGNAQYGTR